MPVRAETLVARAEVGGSRWEMANRTPCPALRPFVRRIAGYDETSLDPQSQRQFPESHVVVIIEFGPPLRVAQRGDRKSAARHRGGFVAALDDAFAIIDHDGHQAGIQVDLTPTGARRFFDIPLSELQGQIVGLGDLWPREHARLTERLAAEDQWSARLDLVEDQLLRRILDSRIDSRRVDWAVAQIERRAGSLPIRDLSRELGWSPKHLITRFRDQVGVPPKQLARLVRFGHAMDRIQGDRAISLSELALTLGFSDQAHLARDVKYFTGLTATQARSENPRLGDLFG